jgi:hypothetical protein
MRKPPFSGRTAASGAVTGNDVAGSDGGLFLFLLYKFRIPDSASNYANFVGVFWLVSGML